MKKILYTASLIAILALNVLAFLPANAQYTGQANVPQAESLHDWMTTVNTVARWIYTIILVAAVILVLYAAILYLTAAGNPDKVKQANKILIYAVVAIVVAVIAFSITKIVGGLIGKETNI